MQKTENTIIIPFLSELNSESLKALSNLASALKVKEKLNTIGMNSTLILCANTHTRIQLTHAAKNTPEKIREIAKLLHCNFEKKLTSCGFLKYDGTPYPNVAITVNTSECYYGGKPEVVVQRPRTKAFCKVPEKKEE